MCRLFHHRAWSTVQGNPECPQLLELNDPLPGGLLTRMFILFVYIENVTLELQANFSLKRLMSDFADVSSFVTGAVIVTLAPY